MHPKGTRSASLHRALTPPPGERIRFLCCSVGADDSVRPLAPAGADPPRGVSKEGRPAGLPSLVVSRMGDFQGGKGNRNPFPLERRFWLLLPPLAKVTRRRQKRRKPPYPSVGPDAHIGPPDKRTLFLSCHCETSPQTGRGNPHPPSPPLFAKVTRRRQKPPKKRRGFRPAFFHPCRITQILTPRSLPRCTPPRTPPWPRPRPPPRRTAAPPPRWSRTG